MTDLLRLDKLNLHSPHDIIVILLIGAAVGFLSGLLGKGGSAVTTPALQVFAGISPFAALASPLPATLPTTLSASFAYAGKKMVNTRLVWMTVLIGIPATIAGSFLSPLVGGHILMLLTALFVLIIGGSFFVPRLQEREATANAVFHPPSWKIILVATGVGGLSGLLANSGGVLFGPLFIRFLKMPTKQALACSLIVSAGLAIPGTIVHWYLGHIDWMIVLLLSLASIPCSYLGAKLALSMRNETLEKIFGVMLVLFGAYDLFFTLIKG